jgi:uncharacterized protein with HEPN domain
LRDSGERLRDILDAISQIERYAVQGQAAFEQDELIQVWIFHHIQIIGEAASQLGREFHDSYPHIPWPQMVAMRNLLVHEYFGVDLTRCGGPSSTICHCSGRRFRSSSMRWWRGRDDLLG